MNRCEEPGCTQGNTMGRYCIRHDYENRGLECPGYEPGGWFATHTKTRPAINAPRVIFGPQETSRRAADRAKLRAGTYREKIYKFIAGRPEGATDEETELELGIAGNTVRPSRVTLVEDGWLKDSGTTRLTRAGNDAIVWIVA